MRKRLLNRINQVLTFCLSALGLAGCMEVEYGCPPVVCEYGVPYATFVAEGNVTNETDEGIGGVTVVVREHEAIPASESGISTKTRTDGTYRTERATIFPTDSVWIHAIDSTGIYAEDSAKVKVNYVTKGDGNWYRGDAEAKADFVLKKKEQ